MQVFVTVGTTRFDKLIQTVLSPEVLTKLKGKGYTSLTLQTGNSNFNKEALESKVLKINQFEFKPSLSTDILKSNLVISHAGAGTCLEVLEAKKALIVVVNEDLMDNHQIELAEKLGEDRHLVHCLCSSLANYIDNFDQESLVPFPPGNLQAFSDFIDQVFNVPIQNQ